jgi:hypothetical protein
MAVAGLFGERESGEQVNCIVSSLLQACPLYAQLLTYRCGAANRRFGPDSDIAGALQIHITRKIDWKLLLRI